ncbi:hypothetical protein L596_014990 [Steinernema carpocapsae]|uniref:Calmodulin-binding domain-containing protein n=1 Tax=Steinernema carpocapsae TaxID=34508 RepID=A0A4U5NDV3_STECR|nr:hypothetical protein L596_014990 [Steinernema carpocapsae]
MPDASRASSLVDNQSLERIENGNGSALGAPTPNRFNRNNSRYGIPIDDDKVTMIYRIRSERLITRVSITDRCLVLALVGILFMIIDAEICGQNLFSIDKNHPISLLIRTFVLLSTVALVGHIAYYHVNEIWVSSTLLKTYRWQTMYLFFLFFSWNWSIAERMTGELWSRRPEFTSSSPKSSSAHSVPCPGPEISTGLSSKPIATSISTPRRRFPSTSCSLCSCSAAFTSSVALWSCTASSSRYKFLLVNSLRRFHQDASTRTLAALNRIQVNFSFVMKTMLDQQPILFLTVFTLVFWVATAWTFAQCERLGRESETPSILYSNALWFIAITFLLNGYGDIVPKTNCGRIIAILVGIIGAIISSILIAVISKKILLSQGQRNVNHFMNDSRLTREQKVAAANVLKQTWHIYKCQTSPAPNSQLRYYQRKFLKAIHEFRRVKNKIRIFGETSSTSAQQMSRLMMEMQNTMQRLVSAQEEMRVQIEVLQRTVRNHFVPTDGSSQRVMFAESISDQGL